MKTILLVENEKFEVGNNDHYMIEFFYHYDDAPRTIFVPISNNQGMVLSTTTVVDGNMTTYTVSGNGKELATCVYTEEVHSDVISDMELELVRNLFKDEVTCSCGAQHTSNPTFHLDYCSIK